MRLAVHQSADRLPVRDKGGLKSPYLIEQKNLRALNLPGRHTMVHGAFNMRTAIIFLSAAALLAGCEPNANQPANQSTAASAAEPAAAAATATGSTLSGIVLERIDAPAFSYLRIQTSAGEVWAGVPSASVEKGAQVTVYDATPMVNFESKSIKRKFALVYLGTLNAAGSSPHTGAAASRSNPHGQVSQAATEVKAGSIPKATSPDARTVAEIWAQKTSLSEKAVTVRGKVVKYNGGVMGRNWVHLQDGTGDRAKGTHDITVTTTNELSMGEVTTLKGIVRLDKDFGAGYVYALMVEDAKVQK